MSQQNDRKLLELAATAAGWMPNNSWAWDDNSGENGAFCYRVSGELVEWNALTSCEDAVLLAVRLGLSVIQDKVHGVCYVYLGDAFYGLALYKDDPVAATCRAIVCAAARLAVLQVQGLHQEQHQKVKWIKDDRKSVCFNRRTLLIFAGNLFRRGAGYEERTGIAY